MSYLSTVLADSPLALWHLDELSGSVMADSSGNENHGVINPLGFSYSPTFGLEKAIETDSSGYAMGGGCGYIPVTSGTDLDVRAAFSLEGWGKQIGGGGGVLIARNGGPGFSNSNWIALDAGIIRFRLSDNTTTWDLTSSALVENAWYHVVGVRNGTAMLLYVNGVLVANRTDLSSGDFVYENYNSSSWKVGASANTVGVSTAEGRVNVSDVCDAVAIYNTALSAGRVLAHYEAAKLVLPLRATIIINLGIELNTDQITPTDLPFAHNYSGTFDDSNIPIVEELSYRTNVNQSEPDYQQRINAQPHGALRSLEYHLSPSSGAARARLQGSLYLPGQTYTLPVWSDVGITTDDTSGSTIPCDTTLRDYEVGSYVGLATDLKDPGSYEFFKITAVDDEELTVSGSPAFDSGSYVFPARLASISEDTLAVKSFAADHEDSVIRFDVLETELSARRITAYTPATTYRSVELLTLESAKYSFLDARPYDVSRRIQAAGRDYQYAMDTGSPQTFPVRFLLTSRAALSQFYGWLDARQGKQNPLWVSTKEKDLIATAAVGSTSVTVKKTGFSFHHGRRDLEFALNDGSFLRARVTAVSDNGDGTETWACGAPTFAQISKISFLKYCTLAQDVIQIRYWKGGANGAVIAECSLNLRELLTS